MVPTPGTLVDGQVRPRCGARVVMVGLGQAAGFTVDALAGLPDVRIVAGVDPLSRDALVRLPPGTPVFASLGDVPSSTEADVAVIATPTGTHVEVCREVLEGMICVRRILCEKPLGTSYKQVRSALDRASSTGVRLDVLYHYAFAPEVSWLAARWQAIETAHGFVVGLSARFDDPKESVRRASATLVSSWADSGINALSILARFVRLGKISTASDGAPAVCRATLQYESGGHALEGSITTNWAASDMLKGTELVLADGTSFTMNHVTGTVACVERNRSELIYEVDRDEPLPRVRYRRMLDAYLRDDGEVFGAALTLRLHELLAEGFRKNGPECGHGFSPG